MGQKRFNLKALLMQGLRVYINSVGPDALTKYGVFYSRRDEGPYYRWHYEEKIDRWCVSRVRLELVPKTLSMAQKAVPTALRRELLEHYLD